jgi:hypothetical protein
MPVLLHDLQILHTSVSVLCRSLRHGILPKPTQNMSADMGVLEVILGTKELVPLVQWPQPGEENRLERVCESYGGDCIRCMDSWDLRHLKRTRMERNVRQASKVGIWDWT